MFSSRGDRDKGFKQQQQQQRVTRDPGVSITSSSTSPIAQKSDVKISEAAIAAKQRMELQAKLEKEIQENEAFFESKENQSRYFKWLASKLHYTMQNDWYKAKRKDFLVNHGARLLARYKGDHIAAITANYADQTWYLWRFPTIQKYFWTDTTRKDYLTWLAKITNKETMEDWHYYTARDFTSNYGAYFIGHYGDVASALKAVYPEYAWKPWLFERLNRAYFNTIANQRLYLDWLGATMGYTEPSAWYQVTQRDFKINHGFQLLKRYNKSPARLIMTVMAKDNQWQSWRFRVIKNKRTNIHVLQEFIDALQAAANVADAKELVGHADTQQLVESLGGQSIMDEFGGSVESSLKALENKESYLKAPEPKSKEDDDDKDFEDLYEFGDEAGFGGDEDVEFLRSLEQQVEKKSKKEKKSPTTRKGNK
eukprot:gene1118-1277_t